jgi:tripartite-type tricarboxylate transporter receptor subunit TctC
MAGQGKKRLMQNNDLKRIGAAAMLCLLASTVLAQNYPSKPLKVIVPYPAGTATDAVTRIVTEALAMSLGQPVIVENRSGASTTIGAAAVATAPADGYTILAHTSSFTSVPAFVQNLPYDTARDFAGVTTLVENPLVLVVGKSTGIQSVGQLIAAGKARPGALTFGSAGAGTISHLSAEKFRLAGGFDALHVAFRGTGDVVKEILGGRIDFAVTTILSAVSGIQDGRLVALAMVSQRSSMLPDVPTIVEAGVPQGGYRSWVGFLVPAKTPREIVNRLQQETVNVLAAPNVKDRLAKIGVEPVISTPDELDALIRREIGENARLVKAAGIKTE